MTYCCGWRWFFLLLLQDYYPTVAITALMRLLKDAKMSGHHNLVLQAVMWIYRSLGSRCVPFLPQVRAQELAAPPRHAVL